ncbi:DUF551 domain-containing protein [Enterobacter asburiae]|uniref:DUF551 domain-containing protein n=1 Tax=Enterobacter asburiae TaxID=61645 RepID=UPI00197AB560|nr:DUF551 domain-containing protein [Enterobacter asburiae]MCE1340511.1 DUF551 domain-containing protein [Enterobacter asburiae]
MSPITKEFTKEQLQQIIETDHVTCGEASELARIALASLEAEPVAWLLSGGGAKNHVSFDSGNAYADPLREVTPLYTAPPAPVSVPYLLEQFAEFMAAESIKSGDYPDGWQCKASNAAHEYAQNIRAVMLQGADGNSPVIPDGWVACSEQMPEDEQEVIVQNKMGYRYVSYFDEHSGLFFDMRGGNQMNCIEHIFVTHWMPMPAAPQQEVIQALAKGMERYGDAMQELAKKEVK